MPTGENIEMGRALFRNVGGVERLALERLVVLDVADVDHTGQADRDLAARLLVVDRGDLEITGDLLALLVRVAVVADEAAGTERVLRGRSGPLDLVLLTPPEQLTETPPVRLIPQR